MPWFSVDDQLHDHRKVRLLGRDRLPCLGLWVLCGSWASADMSDGFIPDEIVERWDPKHRLAERLVDVGMWLREDHHGEAGYRFHDWGEFQMTKAEVLDRRRKRRMAGRRGGVKSGESRRSKGEASASPENQASASHGASTMYEPPSLPIPIRTTPNGVGAGAPANAGTVVKAWVEAFTSVQGRPDPSGGMRAQAGREARRLLEAGARPDLLLMAAHSAGEKGFATIEREYAPLLRPKAPSSGPTLQPWVEQ